MSCTVWDLHNGAELRWRRFHVRGGCKIVIRNSSAIPTVKAAENVVDDGIRLDPAPANLDRPIVDWSNDSHWNRRGARPCVHCTTNTQLLDDRGRPAHKVCAERALARLLSKDAA